MTPLEQALFLASHGFYIVAGYPPGEYERAIIKGTSDGTTDSELITKWFTEIPNRNIMINLKNSGLICVDLDKHHNGQNGVKAFSELWHKHETEPVKTYFEQTPTGGGLHIFFKVPLETFDKPITNEIMDGVEVKKNFTPIYPSKRTDGVYLPPTSEETGDRLTLLDTTEAPQWLLELITQPKKTTHARELNTRRTYTTDIWELFNQGARKGARNNDTNKILHYWRKIGLDPSVCMDLLQAFNNRTAPPLDDDELANIWKSVYKMK